MNYPVAILFPLLAVFLYAGGVGAAVDEGKRLYDAKGCAGCHKVGGEGGEVGPDLSREGTHTDRDRVWHVRHLLNPAEVVPGSIMPVLVANAEEAGHLADYLLSLGAEPAAPVRATPPAAKPAAPAPKPAPPKAAAPSTPLAPTRKSASAGAGVDPTDPARVSAGQSVFANKGCGACHSVRGTGGTLGPDLTYEGEVKEHDADWHRRHLADPPSVTPGSTMPAYDLSVTDRDNLISYLLSLKHLEKDKSLSPELGQRFSALGARLAELKDRIERARRNGRNVDDLNVLLSQAWTHVGTVEEKVRKQALYGVEKEIESAESEAGTLAGELDDFERQLRTRRYQTAVVVGMLAIGCILLLRKIILLTAEWRVEEAERRKKRMRKTLLSTPMGPPPGGAPAAGTPGPSPEGGMPPPNPPPEGGA